MNKVDHREPFTLGRLLIRSALLGLMVPVTQGEFWDVKAVQVVSALVLCLALYGLEKAILWPFRTRLSIKPIYSAAYRGAVLYGLMVAGASGDFYRGLGAGIVAALIAMGLFKAEEGTTRKFVKGNGESLAPQKMKRLQSLNGWRRIWVVIAAISFLYTLWYSLDFGGKQHRFEYGVWSAFEKPECKYVVDLPAGFKLDRDRQPGIDDPCWDLYLYRSIYQDAKNTKDGYNEHMNSLQRNAILQAFAVFLLVYYFPGIGLLYGAGVTVAWVIKGFRSKGAAPKMNG